jgi:hypothetical protein
MLRGRCNSRERKRPYSRVLYLVLFDTALESESVTVNKSHFWTDWMDLLLWEKIKYKINKVL